MTLSTGQRAAAFAADILRDSFAGHSFDGGDVQELAIKHGLLVKVAFDPKKHSGEFDDYCEPGDPWYEFTRGMKLLDTKRRKATP